MNRQPFSFKGTTGNWFQRAIWRIGCHTARIAFRESALDAVFARVALLGKNIDGRTLFEISGIERDGEIQVTERWL